MSMRTARLIVQPMRISGLQEAETWRVFSGWLIKTFEYLAVRKGIDRGPGRQSGSASGGAGRSAGECLRMLQSACTDAGMREPEENGGIRKVVDISRVHQVEIDLNADVESQLAQLAAFMDYLEDCYGTKIVVRAAPGGG